MPQVLIYTSIDSYSASTIAENVELARVSALESGEETVVRIASPGGSPEMGWSILSTIKEITTPVRIKVEGRAYSMGLFACAYFDNVTALDVSQFWLHRAAYGSWWENSEYFTEDQKRNLKSINDKLYEALKNKIDVAALEAIMAKRPELEGKKFKDVFSMDGRLEVPLTAQEAKKIGLISKIEKLTPSKAAEINTQIESFKGIAASQGIQLPELLEPTATIEENDGDKPTPEPTTQTLNNDKMTAEEFKSKHPEAYNAIVKDATTKERDRVTAWTKFQEIDPEAVKNGIESGANLTDNQSVMADLMLKAANPERIKKIENAGADDVDTPAPTGEKTEKELTQEAVLAMVGNNNPEKN